MRTWKHLDEKLPSQSDTWVRRTLVCRFLTPVFGGGVEPRKFDSVTPVRAASIRGQLRFWWRACNPKGLRDVIELKKAETRIFGGIADSGPTASQVHVAVKKQPRRPSDLAVYVNGRPFALQPGMDDLAYAAFPLRSSDERHTHERHIHDVLFDYGEEKFEVEVAWPKASEAHDDVTHDVEAAIWAWAQFGGLGGRVRRGLGAVAVEGVVGLEEGWAQYVCPVSAPWPHLGPIESSLAKAPRAFASGREALGHLLKVFRKLRQGEIGRNPNGARIPGRPGRSYWPEPDAIRRLYRGVVQGRHTQPVSNVDAFPRGQFGAPIIFHFQQEQGEREPPNVTLVPKDCHRLASPLILRPNASGENGVSALAVRLCYPFPSQWELLEREHKKASVRVTVTQQEAAGIRPLCRNGQGSVDVVRRFLDELSRS